jgi:uncharacterized surface protein with fasciclin (FAS1) repeats
MTFINKLETVEGGKNRSSITLVKGWEIKQIPSRRKEIVKIKAKLSALVLSMACAISVMAIPVNGGKEENKDIVETAVAAGGFNTLVEAVKAAGLVDTLKSKGPFTVFAPTDEAFAKLPAGVVDALLKDKEKLKKILLYHVVSGNVTANDVVKLNGKTAKTVQGSPVKITVMGDKVMVENANVVKTDIACANGVIHVIDTVILPK